MGRPKVARTASGFREKGKSKPSESLEQGERNPETGDVKNGVKLEVGRGEST